ncbi:stage II sporulation protein R [Virgibacillus byunsanensis]|uniref:Stage II sporulation protein R n=1 Tax=Virgibacillus byunsanensis TaxID=570945 RepID=A0ABW3LGD3_9BACI
MKKLVFFAFIFFILLLSMPTKGAGNQAVQEDDYQVIPDDAIRLRILANSDSESDQQIKRLIRDEVNEEITKWVEDIADINEARDLIQANLPEIKSIVSSVLEQQDNKESFQVEYGDNVTFPTKLYGSFLYPAGEYEAILITIGDGKGSNWWCVLFPPLCFLDFSNGTSVAETASSEPIEEEEEEDEDSVKIKFFLFEWFGWS